MEKRFLHLHMVGCDVQGQVANPLKVKKVCNVWTEETGNKKKCSQTILYVILKKWWTRIMAHVLHTRSMEHMQRSYGNALAGTSAAS